MAYWMTQTQQGTLRCVDNPRKKAGFYLQSYIYIENPNWWNVLNKYVNLMLSVVLDLNGNLKIYTNAILP